MKRGFTLIEVLIAVAIIGILAAIAIPNYQLYRFRTRTAEVGTLLSSIRAAQDSFYATNDNYADIVAPNPALPGTTYKQQWTVIPCDVNCNRLNPALCVSFECIGFAPASTVYYQYVSPALQGPTDGMTDYAIGAAGDVDGDGVPGSFSFQTSNTNPFAAVAPLTDGLSACLPMPPGQLHNCTPSTF